MNRHSSIINSILPKLVGVKIAVGIQLYYQQFYGELDFEDDDIPNWRAVKAVSGAIKVSISKTGADINVDGNIDVSSDADNSYDLIGVYVNMLPVYSPVFFDPTNLTVGPFDTSISGATPILLRFI